MITHVAECSGCAQVLATSKFGKVFIVEKSGKYTELVEDICGGKHE